MNERIYNTSSLLKLHGQVEVPLNRWCSVLREVMVANKKRSKLTPRRWKGENVATTEVSDILTISDCLKEANVYGVRVPGDAHSPANTELFCYEMG